MPFSYGCAAALYACRRHPRLYTSAAELDTLRRKTRAGWGGQILDALRRKIRPHVRAVEAVENLADALGPNAKGPSARGAVYCLPDLALVGALDRDRRVLDTVRRVLRAIPEADSRQVRDRLSYGYGGGIGLAVAYDLLHTDWAPAERNVVARWLYERCVQETLATLRQAHYLRCPAMNIPMVGMISALLATLAIVGDEGIPDLTTEKTELLRFLEASLRTMFGPEGYPEEDIGYGTSMACLVAFAVETARRAGWFDAYTACPGYARFGRALLHFVQPWGRFLSNTGDYAADLGSGNLMFLFPRLAQATRDPSILWMYGSLLNPVGAAGPMDIKAARRELPVVRLAPGYAVPVNAYTLFALDAVRHPAHPARLKIPTAFRDSQRGIVSFRSSWKPDATFVVFDGSQRSPSAQGHAHDSGGHFSLSALGEYFAIDTGRYNIDQDQHNVVLVDGKSGVTTAGEWRASWYQAMLTDYRPGAFVDTASVNNSQMADCYWSKRTLGLVKDPTGCGMPAWVWTVDDVNKANDYREFWWAMNVHPDHRIQVAADHATVIGSDHGNCLDVFFVLPAPGEYPRPHTLELAQDVQRYGSYNYAMSEGGDVEALAEAYRQKTGHLEYGPVFRRPRLLGKVAGYNGRFMALLIPRRKGAPPPRVETLPTLENALAVRITVGRVSDTLIWAYEHHLLETGDIQGRGAWCVVRRERRSGKVLAWDLADGARLAVAGRSVTASRNA